MVKGMNRLQISALVMVLASFVGCDSDPQNRATSSSREPQTPAQSRNTAAPDNASTVADKKPLGKDLWFQKQGDHRRVLIDARVCLREGKYGLECLLCRSHTKEHESILSTAADARAIHFGLLAAGATPGSPVQYVEKNKQYEIIPPSGARIKVTLQYEEKGKLMRVPAQEWVRDGKTQKKLDCDWVFAGSQFYQDPEQKDKPPVYLAAADGAYICTTNVTTAMLALPINSSNTPEERTFEPFTEHIPPLDTKVTIILEATPEKGKSSAK
jgi:hypothetical protein